MNASVDPRRDDKINRFKPASQGAASEDLVPDYMNILGKSTEFNIPNPKNPPIHKFYLIETAKVHIKIDCTEITMMSLCHS